MNNACLGDVAQIEAFHHSLLDLTEPSVRLCFLITARRRKDTRLFRNLIKFHTVTNADVR